MLLFGYVVGETNLNETDLIGIIFVIIVMILTLYLGLTMINKRFAIIDNKIIYKNIFGKIYRYHMSDIDNVMIERFEFITIKMVDKKIIVLESDKMANIDLVEKRI